MCAYACEACMIPWHGHASCIASHPTILTVTGILHGEMLDFMHAPFFFQLHIIRITDNHACIV